MVKYFLVSLVLHLIIASNNAASTINLRPEESWKIVGGSEAEEGAYPYQVSIRDFQGLHSCGGAIIHPEWILTASHCVEGKKPIHRTVVVGTNSRNGGGVKYNVLEIHWHKDFQWLTTQNDIALLKVEPIAFNEKVQAITLDTDYVDGNEPCTLTGWGRLSHPDGAAPERLQRLDLKTITIEECIKYHGKIKVTQAQVCTFTKAGEGACRGDSGGPLVRIVDGAYKLFGVVSWGTPCAIGDPDVFARVSSYLTWINDICNCVQ